MSKRPTLAKITKHPATGFANYERRLESILDRVGTAWRFN
jgi:hypothetical protein